MGRHYKYLNEWMREHLETHDLFESFERYFNELMAKRTGRQKSLNISMDKFRDVIHDVDRGVATVEALAKQGLREYAKENLPNLPPLGTNDNELLEKLDSFSAPSDGNDDSDAGDEWPEEWKGFKPESIRDRHSTLVEDCRWIYENCPFKYGEIDPNTAPCVGAIGWLMRVKRSPETLDKFYKETLHRYLGKHTEAEEEGGKRDGHVFRLMDKVEAASRRCKAQSETIDVNQNTALPPRAEGPNREHHVPARDVEISR